MAQVQQLTEAQQKQLQNQQMQQQNAIARQIVLQQSYPVVQSVASRSFNPANQNSFEVTPANVGIVKGFIIKVTATITNNGAADLNRTTFGPANILQRVEYYDPSNQRHTNTSGLHLHLVNTAKQGLPFLAALQTDSPVAYGNNYGPLTCPATIAAAATAQISMYYYLPLAYSENDLSGAVLANIPQSQQRLKLQFGRPEDLCVGATDNPVYAMYKSASGAADVEVEEIAYDIYQCYLDQLPVGQNGFILPLADLSTLYCLEDTVVSGMTPNADFTVQYANLYKYLSTIAVFDNGGQLNAGTDLKYISQRSANFSDIRKLDPVTQATFSRRKIDSDFPPGVIYIDNRDKPIYTLQYGNMSFVVNPSTVNANARLIMGYEYLTQRVDLVNAGTIATS